jgi:hypothetical protein
MQSRKREKSTRNRNYEDNDGGNRDEVNTYKKYETLYLSLM